MEERYYRWLAIAKNNPPEWLASYMESDQAHWAIITETGGEKDRIRLTSYLLDPLDLPYWAFALAKSYLDDVGEWPLFGIKTEIALSNWEDHQDPIRAVHEILNTVTPVWPDLKVLYVGQEKT